MYKHVLNNVLHVAYAVQAWMRGIGHRGTWSLIIKEAQRVEHARRASLSEMPTGAELARGLLKQCADQYGKTGRIERYVP